MKPICVPCRRFMRPKRTGLFFVEGMPRANNAPIGLREPSAWQPYKVWSGDLWECPDCKASVISGTGRDPIAIHHQEGFADWLDACKDDIQINDC